MIKKIGILLFISTMCFSGYAQNEKIEKQETVTLEVSTEELLEIIKKRKSVGSTNPEGVTLKILPNEQESQFDLEEVSSTGYDTTNFKSEKTRKEYINLLVFKQNKNKGYKKQPFEDKAKYALLEKGVSFVSFNLGFMGNDMSDYLVEPIAVIDKFRNRNFNGSISAGHFVANNTAVGLKFAYNFSDIRLKVSADILDIIISAKTYESNNVKSRYTGGAYVKNFIPLDAAQRFFIISETNIGYTYVDALSKNIYANGEKVTKVKTDKDVVSLGVSPGFMYFMSSGFAFEFQMSPVVAYWERTRTTNNEVNKGSAQNYGLSFKFMPFNISFGFAYYFGLDYDKNRAYLKSTNKY